MRCEGVAGNDSSKVEIGAVMVFISACSVAFAKLCIFRVQLMLLL